ncbi:hypothetical protein [Streptomyces sp. URMC 129]|uniref:hypothetical protein n=1 Tax=Streptomyces sp. URMC 129 TaxID=3423407 RepID=UPI003F1B0529
MNQQAGVMSPVEIDATTARRGDQLMIGGHVFTIEDMTALPTGGKRLTFTTGEWFTLHPTTTLWATRRISPRLRRRS